MEASHSFRYVGAGQILRFEPGLVLPVNSTNQGPVMAMGAKAVVGTATPVVNTAPDPKRDPNSPEYRGAVREAAERILTANQSSDFGANGKPKISAWEREMGFKPPPAVREEIWDSVRGLHKQSTGA
jgi:hypothetical protein